MNRILTLCLCLLLASVAGAFAAATGTADSAPSVSSPGSAACDPAASAIFSPANAAPEQTLPGLVPEPQPRVPTCDPVKCAKLHGVCECNQFFCRCVPA